MDTNTSLLQSITSPNGLKPCLPSTTPLNHCFGVPLQLVSDHGKHFENEIFIELSSKLGFSHKFSSPYYPQSNGQVEAVNKVLKTMLQRMVVLSGTIRVNHVAAHG
jgi:transposase InsO family protein